MKVALNHDIYNSCNLPYMQESNYDRGTNIHCMGYITMASLRAVWLPK